MLQQLMEAPEVCNQGFIFPSMLLPTHLPWASSADHCSGGQRSLCSQHHSTSLSPAKTPMVFFSDLVFFNLSSRQLPTMLLSRGSAVFGRCSLSRTGSSSRAMEQHTE